MKRASTTVGVCRRCRKTLISCEPVDRDGRHGDVRIHARGLPARVCAGGCPGTYWGDPELGAHLLQALTGGAEWVLPRRRFGRSCPRCSERLWANSHPGRLRAVIPTGDGSPTMVEVEAPVLDCRSCGVSYLDAEGQLSSIQQAVADLLDNRLLRAQASV